MKRVLLSATTFAVFLGLAAGSILLVDWLATFVVGRVFLGIALTLMLGWFAWIIWELFDEA